MDCRFSSGRCPTLGCVGSPLLPSGVAQTLAQPREPEPRRSRFLDGLPIEVLVPIVACSAFPGFAVAWSLGSCRCGVHPVPFFVGYVVTAWVFVLLSKAIFRVIAGFTREPRSESRNLDWLAQEIARARHAAR